MRLVERFEITRPLEQMELALVRGAASIDRQTETKAERLLAELEARLPAARFAAAQARGRVLELGATVAAILAKVAA